LSVLGEEEDFGEEEDEEEEGVETDELEEDGDKSDEEEDETTEDEARNWPGEGWKPAGGLVPGVGVAMPSKLGGLPDIEKMKQMFVNRVS